MAADWFWSHCAEDGFVNVPDMDADYIRVDGEAGESEGSLGKPAEAEGEAGDSSDGEDLQRLSEEEKEEVGVPYASALKAGDPRHM